MSALLEIKDLNAFYGKSHVLHGVDLVVNQGEIVSLLGRNGVGRSTTVKATMGQVDSKGSIKFKGEEIIGLKAFQIAHKGLGYVPENRDIFPTLTVEQNLILGEKSGKKSRWCLDDMYQMFPRLKERQHTAAGVLSGGEQQRVAIARAIVNRPQIILADEPTAFLDRENANKVINALKAFQSAGVTCIISSHDEQFLDQASRVIYLNHGQLCDSWQSSSMAA